MEWRPVEWSMCLPLLIFSCTIKSRSSPMAPAHPRGPGKRAVKRLGCGDGSFSFLLQYLMLFFIPCELLLSTMRVSECPWFADINVSQGNVAIQHQGIQMLNSLYIFFGFTRLSSNIVQIFTALCKRRFRHSLIVSRMLQPRYAQISHWLSSLPSCVFF